jgi:hypothetical protein
VGQRTFETRSLYLILAEKLFTLPAANEMLALSALFAGKYREVGMWQGFLGRDKGTDGSTPKDCSHQEERQDTFPSASR